MPIPVNPDKYLAQVVMRPDTSPNSNSFVNTFYFMDTVGGTPFQDVCDIIEAQLEAFYNTAAPGTGLTVAGSLSVIIDPTLTVVKIYDLGEAAPRTPEVRGMASWTVGTSALPNECAVVLSFVSGPQSVTGGTNDKTARGRVYIGPLANAAGTYVSGSDDLPVTPSFVTTLKEVAERMRDNPDPEAKWAQYSRKDNAFAEVVGGFVDNRFDTQRRRGARATTRTVW